jgi:hypothetical protein
MTGQSKSCSKLFVPTTLAVLMLGLVSHVSADGLLGGLQDLWGPRYTYDGPPALELLSSRAPNMGSGTDATNSFFYWNEVMTDANAIDHTPVAPGESRAFGEQVGPARTARAFAIVHIAVFDAVNAIVGGYQSYTCIDPAPDGASVRAATAQAAHDTLAALYPSQKPRFDAALANDLSYVPTGMSKLNGIETGRRAAEAILRLRENDGSDHVEPRIGFEFFPSDQPGKWRRIRLPSIRSRSEHGGAWSNRWSSRRPVSSALRLRPR